MMPFGPFPAMPGDLRKQVISLEYSLMMEQEPDKPGPGFASTQVSVWEGPWSD